MTRETRTILIIGAGVVLLVLLLVIAGGIAVIGSVNSRDEASYQYGYNEISPLAVTMSSQGFGRDEKSVCEQAFGMVAGFATNYVRGDVIAGCIDGIRAKRK